MKKRFSLSIFLLALTVFIFPASAAIIESAGWLETIYVRWAKEPCAAKYNVYYRQMSAIPEEGAWTKIDDRLIREYPDHFRADILGLVGGGIYNVKIAFVNGGNELSNPAPMTVSNIQVLAQERTGFAFKGGVPGAYKADGTLKDGAIILYVTEQTKNTVNLAVKTSAGATTATSGLAPIIKAMEKGYEDRPIVFRFIGKVTDNNMTGLSDGGGDISIKDNCNNNTTGSITFEGVGNDAVAYGWGFKTARAKNVEIRNLGFMLTNSTEKDNIGLNTNSSYFWIHNNDFFYGNAGSDADQVKGDGATDVKASTNVTISYNHYWDNGKTHLFGNSSSETPGYITTHHNWYDHSDSRHPRVRKHYVHVYNNYYDGVPTYGIGAVMASSIFSERNYFRNTNRPMTISMQGSDDGTFSNEDGGMIKAFDNFMDAATKSKNKYTPWSSSNTVEFDAYEVSAAAAEVPSSVKAKQGGATFNNSMLSGYPSYTSQSDSAAIRTQVKTYAGRVKGGDFTFTFGSSDDGSKDVNTALKTALQNYASKLVGVQEPGAGGSVPCNVTNVLPNSYARGRVNALLMVNNALTLRTTARTSVEIFNLKGSAVRSLKFAPGNHVVPLGGLPRGTYIVKAKSALWEKTMKACVADKTGFIARVRD
jgi:pectate lyase